MRKTEAAIFAAGLVLCMCACGSTPEVLNADELKGSWICAEQNVASEVAALLAETDDPEMQELLPYIELGNITAERQLTLDPDGSFMLTAYSERVRDEAMQKLREGFDSYVETATAEAIDECGHTEEEYRAALGISENEELLPALGVDKDAIFEDFAPEAKLEGLSDALTQNGTYELKDGKLILRSGSHISRMEYDKAAGTLSFTDQSDALYPLSFSRAG